MEKNHMRPSILPTAIAVAALVFAAGAATSAHAQMKDHTALVTAVKAAGLVDTLQAPGPFTVFAPTNAAFQKLPTGTVDSLLKPQMKEKLVAVLTYHVLPGRLTVKDLWDASNKGGGKAKFKTVEGEQLTVEFK